MGDPGPGCTLKHQPIRLLRAAFAGRRRGIDSRRCPPFSAQVIAELDWTHRGLSPRNRGHSCQLPSENPKGRSVRLKLLHRSGTQSRRGLNRGGRGPSSQTSPFSGNGIVPVPSNLLEPTRTRSSSRRSYSPAVISVVGLAIRVRTSVTRWRS